MTFENTRIWRCESCEARRETQLGAPAPTCGALESNQQRFPDGSWIRVETWTPHGEMIDTGERLNGNPLASASSPSLLTTPEREAQRRAYEETVNRAIG